MGTTGRITTGRVVLALSLFVPTGAMGVAQGLIPPAIPTLADDYLIAPALAAQVVTAQLLGRFVTLIPSGLVADRLGGRGAMVLAAALLLLAAGISTVAPSFVVLLLAQSLVGMCLGLWQIGREILTVDMVGVERRGILLSTFFGILTAGQTVGPLIGGITVDNVGQRPVFAIQAACALLVLVLALVTPARQTRRAATAPKVKLVPRFHDLAPIYRGTFLALMFGSFATQVRQSTVNALLPLIGTDVGLSATQVGVLFVITAIFNLIWMGPAGYICDHVGRKAAVIPTAALGALAFVLYSQAHTFEQLALVCVVMGTASGFGLGSLTTYTYDISPPQARGAFQGLRRMAGDLGGFSGPAVGGLIASFATAGTALLVFSPLHVVSALLFLTVARESLPKRANPPPPPSP